MHDLVALSHYHRPGWLGHQVLFRDQVGSTNDLALEMAQDGAREGLVVLAEEQTAGRGRLNRRWWAPAGTCLLVSLVFRPQAPFQMKASRITMACGLALLDAIRAETGVPVMLKWPNDVIVSREGSWGKLAGMLSEVGLEHGQPAVLVVGIGLNVNVPRESLAHLAPNAASLLVEGGSEVDRTALLDVFLSSAENRITAMRAGGDVLDEWRDGLAWMGQPVVVKTPTAVVKCVAETVDAEGALVVRLSDGSSCRFTAGDISLRPSLAN